MPAKQNQKNFERLFLLEFLVDHVIINNSKLNLENVALSSLGPIVVRFQFLTYPPIEIREEDFTPSTKPLVEEKRILFKSGRSCMFSLSPSKSEKLCQSDFDVAIKVYRKRIDKENLARGEINPDQDIMFIGATKINMNEGLKDLICKSDGLNSKDSMTRTRTAAQKLINNNGESVGKMVFLIRISCFGYMVLTGFKLTDEEKKNFKYKNITELSEDRSSKSIDAKKGKPEKDTDRESARLTKPITNKDEEYEKIPKDCKPKKERDSRTSSDKRGTCGPCLVPCPYGFPKPQPPCGLCPCGNPCPYGPPEPQPPCGLSPCGKSGVFPQAPNQNAYRSSQYIQSPSCYQSQPYTQGQQRYQSVTSVIPPSMIASTRVKDVDIEPGSVAIKGNQLVFRIPDKKTDPVPFEGKFSSSVYYTMGDETKEAPRNVIQILPENPVATTLDESDLPNDKQDVLLLKLGNKRLAAGKKAKMELVLKTPKMKRDKPVTDSQQTQYLEADIPKPAKKPGSAKSSQKGKGKKGKKK